MQQATQRKVTVIPKRPIIALSPDGFVQRKRVCAYCRVSTKEEEQLESLENQTLHYNKFIGEHPEWENLGIYADPGLSGTMLKKRDEFNRMVADGKSGKFDLVLIKSISRYCRNTVDSLKTARDLAAHGVVIYFEKERIYSNEPGTEMLFTILSSFAQEESRSTSQNVTYGYRMKFKTGMAKIRTSYGYKSDGNGGLEIVPNEARVVQKAFEYYMDGYSTQEIAKIFNAEGIPTKTKKSSWCGSVILNWLSNEKYIGDTRFQKIYTIDFLTHKQVKNNGELESYYIENTHDPIISKEDFALVQAELKRRTELRGNTNTGWTKYSGKYAFSNVLRCSSCGSRFVRMAYEVKGPEKHRRVWACQTKNKEMNGCNNRFSIPEQEIEQSFVTAVKELVSDDTIVSDIMLSVAESLDTAKVSDHMIKFDEELNQHRQRLYDLMQIKVNSNHARRQIDEEIQGIMRKTDTIQTERDKLLQNVERSQLDEKRLNEMREFVENNKPTNEFDKDLFRKLIHHAVIHNRNEIEFFFCTGQSKRVQIGNVATTKPIVI